MKKITVYSAILFAGLSLSSCGGMETKSTEVAAADVPAAVLTAFNEKYPGATDVKWEKELENNKTEYEAKFTLNGKTSEAEFEEAGTFIKED
jgi:ABC-type glycerol-3-phosphate transport system substrate-binding protein